MARRPPSAPAAAPPRGRRASSAPAIVLPLAGLQPALSSQLVLRLEESLPDGQTRWRITAPAAAVPATPLPEPSAAGGAAPSPSPMVMAATIDLTIWPDAYFTVAALLLTGAQLVTPRDYLAAVADILARAVAAPPKSVQLPDGRRLRPAAQDLAQLAALAARCSAAAAEPSAPAAPDSPFTARLDHAPWAQPEPRPAPAAPAPAAAPSDDYLLIPSAGHYAALQQALALNTFTSTDASRFPRAPLDKGGARGFAELRPVTPEQEYLMAPEEATALARRMWEQREDLSDLDADVLDAISAAWLSRGPRAASDRVPVYVDDLLRARGLTPKKGGQGRRGGFHPDQKADLWRCLLHLQDLWIDIAEARVIDQDDRGRRTQRTRTLQSRAFVMTDRIGQRRLDGTMDVEAILVSPGEAFGRFLLGPGRQLALLSSAALRYNPARQRPEKRLARYLSWQWRVGAHMGDFLRTYRVSTLLQELGLEVNAQEPSWTRERFERALDQLHQDSLISGWQYGDGWRDDALSRKAWVPLWLEARVVVEAPEVIKTAYHRLDRLDPLEQPRTRELPAGDSWAARLKQHREKLGISQMVAAEQIGTSRVYLAQVERGRKPSPSLEDKLRRWIEGGQVAPELS